MRNKRRHLLCLEKLENQSVSLREMREDSRKKIEKKREYLKIKPETDMTLEESKAFLYSLFQGEES